MPRLRWANKQRAHMIDAPSIPPDPEWPPGQGEMASRIRDYDWGATALGPSEEWPQSLRTIVSTVLNSPLPMMVLWGDSLVQIYNDSYRILMAETHRNGLGHPTEDVWPELKSLTTPIYEAVLEGDTRSLHDQRLTISRWPAPEIGWFDLVFSPLREETGQVGGVLVTLVDTTLAVQASQGLREREGLVDHIVQSARDYAIFSLDAEGVITDWPAGAEAVFGWTAAEALGRHFALTFPNQDVDAGEPKRELAVAHENGVAPDVRWHAGKGGTFVYIDGVTRALRDSDERLTGFVKIGQDVTARRQMQQEIRENEARLRTLMEGIPQLVWRAVGSGEWTWASPQWTARTGLSEEDSRGHGWLEAVHPADRDAVMTAWRDAEQRGVLDVDFRVLQAESATYGWFQTRASPLRDDGGNIVEWLGTSTDIDELRRLHEHEHILLGELQHRVRNTLAIVRTLASRTAETSQTAEEMVMKLTGRLDAFARVQSAVTRNPSGGMELSTIIAGEFLANAVKEGDRLTLDGPSITFNFRSAERVALAIHELAMNAFEHGALTKPGGKVSVKWRVEKKQDAGWLVIDWQETGVTFDEAPLHNGFGLELIKRSLPYEMKAHTEVHLERGGMNCLVELPLKGHVAENAED